MLCVNGHRQVVDERGSQHRVNAFYVQKVHGNWIFSSGFGIGRMGREKKREKNAMDFVIKPNIVLNNAVLSNWVCIQ